VATRKRTGNDRLGFGSLGVFSANAWLEEGDGLVASARLIRARWLRMKREIRSKKTGPRGNQWITLSGYPRASVLLLGYAVEMYLKAGLAKWLTNCPEYVLQKDLLVFGHDYPRLADALEIEPSLAPRDLLEFLSKAVKLEARYPATPEDDETMIDAINRRTSRLWSSKRFKELSGMAKRLRAHVQRMDGDNDNPSSFVTMKMDRDGYLVFRVGGHLPWRVTVRPPRGLAMAKRDVENLLQTIDSIEVGLCWPQCDLYLDNGKQAALFKPA